MSANPAQISVKGSDARSFVCTVGATALQFGNLCKISSFLMVPLAANDKQISIFVAQGNYAASATRTQFVPFNDQLVSIPYTGGTPVVGLAYGLNGPAELDVTDTTNKVVEVVEVDTANELAWVKDYHLAS